MEPSPEPTYIRQTGDLDGPKQVQVWISSCRDAANAKGCTFARVTWMETPDDGPTLYLYEAWLTQPADQGQPRFMLVAGA